MLILFLTVTVMGRCAQKPEGRTNLLLPLS